MFLVKVLFRLFFKLFLILITVILFLGALVFLYLQSGKPHIDINYIDVINEANHIDQDPSLNAALVYQQAIDNFTNLDEVAREMGISSPPLTYSYLSKRELDEIPQDRLDLFKENHKQNVKAIDFYKEASQLPYYGIERFSNTNSLIDLECPELLFHKCMVRILTIDADIKMQSGDYAGALENYLTILEAGRHLLLPELRISVEEMVSIYFSSVGYDGLLKMLSQASLDKSDLDRIRDYLTQNVIVGSDSKSLKMERLLGLDIIQHSYTRDTFGRGHFSPSGVYMLDPFKYTPDNMPRKSLGTLCALFFVPRKKVEKIFEAKFNYCEEFLQVTPWDSRNMSKPEQCDFDKVSYFKELRHYIPAVYQPKIEQISRLKYKLQTNYYATLTIVVLHQYKLEYGNFPKSLDELVAAGFLESVPLDAYGPGTLSYRLLDDDFLLYSFGYNYEDDNGKWGMSKRKDISKTDQVEYKYSGEPKRMNGYGGDDVFWPIEQ